MKLFFPLLGALSWQGDLPPVSHTDILSRDVAWLVHQIALPKDEGFSIELQKPKMKEEKLWVAPEMRQIINQQIEKDWVDKTHFWVLTPEKQKAFLIRGLWYSNETLVEYEITFHFSGTDSYSVRVPINNPNGELLFRLTNTLWLIIWWKYQRKMANIDIQELYQDLQASWIIRNTSSQNN